MIDDDDADSGADQVDEASALVTTILTGLITSEPFCRKAIPHLKPVYFEGASRKLYELILAFISKYNKLPTATVLGVEYKSDDSYGNKETAEVEALIGECSRITDVLDVDWLVDTTEKWCQERAMFLAVMEAITIIDGKGKDGKTQGSLPELFTQALAVSFDTNVGHDYIEDAESRFEHYHSIEDKIPFDLEMMNKITKGGVNKKTLNIILAGTGVGKSLGMCHFAAADLAAGRDVLYITLEMSEEKICERIDQNLFDMTNDEIIAMPEDKFMKTVEKLKQSTHGRLIVKEYPTAAAHTGHFRALLQELKLKKNFKPTVIYVDYLNICASSRIKGLSGSVNTYSLIKSIAEELRGLAVEFDVPIWSATQVTRAGFGNTDVELTDTSESFGLPATADLMIAFISTEQLEQMNQIMVKQLKNRYHDVNWNKRFCIGIDRPKMRLYDIDDPSAGLNSLADAASSPANNAVKQTPFQAGQAMKKKLQTSGFKV